MIFPSITEYRDALRFEGALKKYTTLELVTDSKGQPCFSSGNFSVVFRMQDKLTRKEYAVKCFTRDQERRQKSYELISKNLNRRNSHYLVHYEYLTDEVWVNSKMAGDSDYPAVIMEWVESKTLGERLSELCKGEDKPGIFELACSFDRMALWLMEQSFAHGDLKTDNILVEPDGSLRLIDYDGMFTPEMMGETARENGSPGFRHPKRSANHFGPHIDDFSILLISLSLHALAEDPTISNQYSFGDAILLDEAALNSLGEGKPWELLDKLRSNNEVSQRLVMLFMATGNPAEMRLFGIKPILKSAAEKAPKPIIAIADRDELPKLIPFRKGDLWGYCDKNKMIKISTTYFLAKPFSEGLACVYSYGGNGYIDFSNKVVIDFKFDIAGEFNENRARVKLNNKWGLIDNWGNQIVDFKYDDIRDFKEGLAKVALYGKWGFINKFGTEVIDCKYDEVSDFSGGKASVNMSSVMQKLNSIILSKKLMQRLNELPNPEDIHFDIDTFGNKISSEYDIVGKKKFNNDVLTIVYDNGKCGVINKQGKLIIPKIYERISGFSDDYIEVVLNKKSGLIDTNGNIIVQCKYDIIYSFFRDIAAVHNNNKKGFINIKGEEIIPLKYDNMLSEREDTLTRVTQKGKYGVVEPSTGKELIPCIYDDLHSFKENLSVAKLDAKYGFIDKYGKIHIPFKYDYASSFSGGLAFVEKKEKCGFIDKSGTEYWEN